jgi:hypothetical protein
VRLLPNELVRRGQLRCFFDFRIGRRLAAVADVVSDRAFEQIGLLRNIGDLLAQRLLRHL